MSLRTELKLYFWSQRPPPRRALSLIGSVCVCVFAYEHICLTAAFGFVLSDICVSTFACVSHANGALSPAPRPEVMGRYTLLPLPGSDEYSQQHAPLP